MFQLQFKSIKLSSLFLNRKANCDCYNKKTFYQPQHLLINPLKLQHHLLNSAMNISIINYQPQYAAEFKQLNLEWLDKFNLTEDADLRMLDDPEGQILAAGGAIFLALSGDEVVATGAIIKQTDDVYELAKMAVAPAFRGKGISKLILEKCIEEAVQKKASKLFLLSNSQLTTALSLYEKYGFNHVPVVNSYYHTADIMMEKLL